MASANTSGRSSGYVSIPVEIVSSPTQNSYTKPLGTTGFDHSFNGFFESPSWKRPLASTSTKRHIQPRQTLGPAYDRLIRSSHFNRPMYDSSFTRPYQEPIYRRTNEPTSFYSSRSNEDLLSSNDPLRSTNNSFYPSTFNNGFRKNSDFVESDARRHSHVFLHEEPHSTKNFSTHQQNLPEQQFYNRSTGFTQNQHFAPKSNDSDDQSRSPAPQHDESSARSAPSTSQQVYESDFKMPKDGTSQTSGHVGSSGTSSDQQVPSTDLPSSTCSIPVQDPNVVALEALDRIKQNLADLSQKVDIFSGSTRDDRTYKELDEQALKLIIRCDALTDVNSDVKVKRKEMIQNVQTVVAKLESKVPLDSATDSNSNQNVMAHTTQNLSFNNTEQDRSSQMLTEDISTER